MDERETIGSKAKGLARRIALPVAFTLGSAYASICGINYINNVGSEPLVQQYTSARDHVTKLNELAELNKSTYRKDGLKKEPYIEIRNILEKEIGDERQNMEKAELLDNKISSKQSNRELAVFGSIISGIATFIFGAYSLSKISPAKEKEEKKSKYSGGKGI
jgi:hypothetical protein